MLDRAGDRREHADPLLPRRYVAAGALGRMLPLGPDQARTDCFTAGPQRRDPAITAAH